MLRRILVGLLLFVVFLLYFDIRPELFWNEQNGVVRISDFAYYLTIIRGVLAGDGTRFYLADTHAPAIAGLTGILPQSTMPIGASPTIFLLFVAFALMPVSFYAYSVAILNAVGISVFIACWSHLANWVRRADVRLTVRIYGLLTVILFSVSSQTNFLLGQTALLSCGLLCWTFVLLRSNRTRLKSLLLILIGVIVSIKVHYFAIYLALLLGFARYREFLQAIICTLVVSVMCLKLMASNLTEYITSLQIFAAVAKPESLSGAFPFERMVIFNTAFKDLLGIVRAAQFSNFFAVLLLGIAGYNLLILKCRQNAAVSAVLVTTAYLLFTPHMGSEYEDLLICFPLFVTMTVLLRLPDNRKYWFADILVLSAFLTLNRDLTSFLFSIRVLWLIKMLVLSFVLVIITRVVSSAEQPS